MPRYTDSSKDRVRDAIEMAELVGTRTELRRAGPGRYMGRCPFHDERTASFSVDADRKLYHCFGCGVGGDAFDFVRETEGLDFVGALEWLAARYGVQLEVADEDPAAAERRRHRERLLELLERAAAFYVRYLWESQEAAPAREYLASRGLEEATLREFRVGYAPSAWDKLMMAGRGQGFSNREIFDAGLAVRAKGEGRIYDRFRRRITFPLCDARGRVLGFGARAMGADQRPKYLNSSDNEVFHKGRLVYAADLARAAAGRAEKVIVAEGYTDVLMLHQAGVKNVVGLMGTAMTEQQVGELAKLAPTVLLALDADSAGQEAMLRAAKLAQGRRLELRVVTLPDGLDPADLVQQRGARAAQQAVEESVPFVRFRVLRELDTADLSDAEGKDRAIAALRPVFATIPPSAMREELVRLVADRTDLSPTLVSSWLPAPGVAAAAAPPQPRSGPQRPNGTGGGGGGGGGRPPAAARLDPAVRAERDLLAQCLAIPEAGADALARVPAEAFTDELSRRAAEHLRQNLKTPEHGIADDDSPLRALIAGLVARSRVMQPSTHALDGQLAMVEYFHIDRQIEAARREGTGGIAQLVRKKGLAKERMEAHHTATLQESVPD